MRDRAQNPARATAFLRGAIVRVVLAGLLSSGVGIPAAATNGDSAQAYRRGYNLILDGSWQEALAAFDILAERYPASDWLDDAAFWRCYARQRLGQPSAEIFDCYQDLLDRYPKSEWQDDARRKLVRLAQILDREGRPEYREKVRGFGDDEDADRTLAILVALGEIGDDRSVEVILDRLDSASDERMRARIVEVLEDVESQLVIERLQSLFETDPSERVRLAALEALADHDHFDSAPLLRKIVLDPSQPIQVRLEALDELGDDEPPGLLHLLKQIALGENDELALEAIDEIGEIDGEETVRVLKEILDQTPTFERRVEVLETIEDLDAAGAVAVLFEVARSDPDPRLRREATESLGDMETEAARDALIELLRQTEN